MNSYVANEYGMIKLPIDEFVDYLTPILNEVGVETIELTKSVCFDRDRYHYVAKSTRLFYGYGREWTKEEAFKKMAEQLKILVEKRIMTDEHYGETPVDRIGIYNIQIQETKAGVGGKKEMEEIVGVWCRYSFPSVVDK